MASTTTESTTTEELWQRKRVYMDALNAMTGQHTALVRTNAKLSIRPSADSIAEFSTAVKREQELEEAVVIAARDFLDYSAKYLDEHPA